MHSMQVYETELFFAYGLVGLNYTKLESSSTVPFIGDTYVYETSEIGGNFG